jgi:manganese/zinc/iron transport system permease protein
MIEVASWTILDTWIVVTGVLCAMSCALLGNYLLLRRMSMMGDAISHAVLPGLAVAFLITGSRSGVIMLIGAGIVGILTALFTEWVRQLGKVDEGASMGVVFTTLFAVGLVLIVRGADAVDLDPGCVLYGSIEMIPLDTVAIFGLEVPRAAIVLACVFAIDVLFVLFFYKELRISSFDPGLATSLGLRASLMHYLLMTLVAVTTVAAFESVGSILVIAMLIVPAAAAHLLTDRLGVMLVISLVVAAASAILGHIAAITVPRWFGYADTNTAGMMAVAAGCLFSASILLAPKHGVLPRLIDRIRLALRVTREDVLGLLFRLREREQAAQPGGIAALLHEALGRSPWVTRLAVRRLQLGGRVRTDGGRLDLTLPGMEEARHLVRVHRLWESYLAKHTPLASDHLHGPAEKMEHFISSTMGRALAKELVDVEVDPHGKPIPHHRQSEQDHAPRVDDPENLS